MPCSFCNPSDSSSIAEYCDTAYKLYSIFELKFCCIENKYFSFKLTLKSEDIRLLEKIIINKYGIFKTHLMIKPKPEFEKTIGNNNIIINFDSIAFINNLQKIYIINKTIKSKFEIKNIKYNPNNNFFGESYSVLQYINKLNDHNSYINDICNLSLFNGYSKENIPKDLIIDNYINFKYEDTEGDSEPKKDK